MFKIRDFSKFTRVSVKMLRHYDELGLLKPIFVAPETHYRYYSCEQLPRLNRIIALKDLGFSLEQIAKMLDKTLPLEELRGMLKLRRAEIEQHLSEEEKKLARVEARLRHLEDFGQLPQHEVVLRDVPVQWVASLRHTIVHEDEIARLFDEVEEHVSRYAARAADSPFLIYHDEDFHEEGQDIEVAVPITKPIPAKDKVQIREEKSASQMACLVYTGGYEHMSDALHSLMIWVETNRYRPVGALREVYLRFHADSAERFGLPRAFLTDRKELLVTELQLPVELLSATSQEVLRNSDLPNDSLSKLKTS